MAFIFLGVILMPVVSVPAIIFGRIGMTRADQGRATNRGIAQAGFILGIVGAALWVVLAVLVVVLIRR